MGKDQFTPRRTIDTKERVVALPPPTEKRKIPAKEYLHQVVERGGITSCFPTSLLNAMIYQNYISPDEARRLQELIVRHPRYKNHWYEVVIEKEQMKVWSGDTIVITNAVRDITGKDVPIEWIQLKHLAYQPEFIAEKLFLGYAVVGGDINHAALAVTYNQPGDNTTVIDPRFPQNPRPMGMNAFAQFCNDHGWINLI